MIRKSITLFFAILMMCATFSCGKSSSEDKPVVTFSSVKQSDTTTFRRSNGELCQVLVDASITYPKSFSDKELTKRLQQTYIKLVLGVENEENIDKAINQFISEKLSQNANDEQRDDREDDLEACSPNDRVIVNINITVAYHENNILTICKEETFTKGAVPSKTHFYYNIDLNTMKSIDLSMLKSESMTDVCKALKNQLLTQNNVATADELNELGYFNIDNLTVTSNFCFGEKGVTFSYYPQELAADANLEPKITLDYETMGQWASDDSVLKRF